MVQSLEQGTPMVTGDDAATSAPSPYAVSPFFAFVLALLHPAIGMTYATSQWRIGLSIVVLYHAGKLIGHLIYAQTALLSVLVILYSLLFSVVVVLAFLAAREAQQVKVRSQTFAKVLGVVCLSVLLSYTASTQWLTHIYKVYSHSMTPTIASGDYLMVSKMAYGMWNPLTAQQMFGSSRPARGDVVVFLYPKAPDKVYIKRIIGLPGDSIELKQGLLYINGKPIPRIYKGPFSYKAWDSDKKAWVTRRAQAFEETMADKTYTTLHDQAGLPQWRNWSSRHHAQQHQPPWGPRIPPGYVFVLGDNRDRSADSRDWGLVAQHKIIGKVLHILLSHAQHIRWQRIGKRVK